MLITLENKLNEQIKIVSSGLNSENIYEENLQVIVWFIYLLVTIFLINTLVCNL